jgi:hypothetical protein
MKFTFLIICSIFLSVFSLKKEIAPKLCINCKYIIKNDIKDDNKMIYSKCSFFPRLENSANFLVSGVEDKDYFFCSTARQYDNMCGKEGKNYKKNVSKKHLSK